MIRSRFFWQLYTGYVFLAVVFAALVAVSVGSSVSNQTLEDMKADLGAEAVLLEQVALPELGQGPSSPGIQDRVRRLRDKLKTRLTVMDLEGHVLADSREDPALMENHSRRPEIVHARESGGGFATRYSHTLDRHMMYVARRVDVEGKPVGFVRTAIDLSTVDERLAKVYGLVVLGGAVAVLGALFLGLIMARRTTQPMRAIMSAAQGMAGGDYSRRAVVDHGGELGALAAAFNSMAAEIQRRVDALTQEKNTLETILGGMVEGVIAVDLDERIVHMNSIAASMLEVKARDAVGERVWEATRVHEIARSLSTALKGDRGIQTQARIMKDDDESLLEIVASPLHDAGGASAGAVVVFHDVTEMRRLELVRREFVVNASHELKTPITAIRGFLETLVSDPDMPVETRVRFMQRAAAQGNRLSALVTDLLQLSRVETGSGLELTRMDLRDVASRSMRDHSELAVSKGVEIVSEFGDERVPVLGDRATLALVVDNLVDNAVKYTPEGGTVHIITGVEDSKAYVEVADNGIGIESNHVDRIFERFYRVDKARSRELGGTGLGLAIAKHACALLGGHITVRSEPGAGSAFRVSLPMQE